jgi:5-(carboxyamino)imidazole ribonucleotide synthase
MGGKRVGVVGGGQLALMMGEAAARLGLPAFAVLDPTPDCPAAPVATRQIVADFADPAGLRELASISDVLTFEIELAGAETLAELETAGVVIQPSPATLAVIQDKLRQKERLSAAGVPVATFAPIAAATPAGVVEAAARLGGYPLVLKARRGGYDGRGNALVAGPDDISAALDRLAGRALYAEAVVPFVRELAVMVARTAAGEVVAYPVVETVHTRHICDVTIAPAPISPAAAERAVAVASRAIASLGGAGVFGVELFQTADDRIWLNEIAPRPHNSGHYTIEGCQTSQFEQHLRAITGLPLCPTDLTAPCVVMINILGENRAPRPAAPSGVEAAQALGGHVHLYGKRETRFDRKMGHITVLGDTVEETLARARAARAQISI